jgi:ABC-2 type transport system ATP-binding protein
MIETKGLRKSFHVGKRRKAVTVDAVRGVDLKVGDAEIFGFLGPNGAGKTTTLRMLTTLLEPDGGEAVIAGAELRSNPAAVRRLSGYVAQGGGTVDDATAREELVLQARMYGIDKVEATKRAADALDAFQLSEFADRKCRTYSGGQRRRLDIALGVIHRPKVLFLDEPTVGLDPQSRARMWDEVRRLRENGMTVFLTTHYLDEADALADRILVMDDGRIVADDTPEALKGHIAGDVVTLGLDNASPADLARAAAAARAAISTREVEIGVGRLLVTVDEGPAAVAPLTRAMDAAGLVLITVDISRPSLDDVFLTLTGRSLREGSETPAEAS